MTWLSRKMKADGYATFCVKEVDKTGIHSHNAMEVIRQLFLYDNLLLVLLGSKYCGMMLD